MIKGKIYPYMIRKKQINVNLSKVVLKALDKYRVEVDDYFLEKPLSRSQFIQKALVHYMGFLIGYKDKLGGSGE